MSKLWDISTDPKTGQQVIVPKGPAKLGPDQQSIADWYSSRHVRGLENVQLALVRMLTISASFATGGVAFLRQAIGKDFQVVFVLLTLLSMAIALAGSTPIGSSIRGSYLQNIKDGFIAVINRKKAFLAASVVAFCCAMVVAAVGMYLS